MLAVAIRNFDVPWARASILRHSVGTSHRLFAMARWARLRFALLWFIGFRCFFVKGWLLGCLIVGCRIVGLSDYFGNGFPQRLGKF